MAKTKKIQPIKKYTEEEIDLIIDELFKWFDEKPENIFVDDFLLDKKKIFINDVNYLIETNEKFNLYVLQARQIELSRLKKHAAGDRLNASIVNKILINTHNWD